MSAQAPSASRSILDNVEPLLRSGDKVLSLGGILEKIEDGDGPGPVLLVLTLPVLLPLPPGVSMLMAIPLLLAAPQIMVGKRVLWIPPWLAKREIKRDALKKLVRRWSPLLQRVENKVHPRLGFLTGKIGSCIVGAACTVLALVLVLPIPFANLFPALAMGVFALGLSRKDGLFILMGFALMLFAALVIAFAAHGAVLAYHYLRSVI